MRINNVTRIIVEVVLLLMIPLIAMQFSTEWNWTFFDFVFAGTVLFGAGLGFEFISRRGGFTYKAALAIAMSTGFFLIWINGAVGLIGDDDWPNLLCLSTIVIGILGALISKFRASGLSRTLYTMAVLVFLIPIIVLVSGSHVIYLMPGVMGVLVLNGLFVIGFALAGFLFKKAGEIK